MTTDTNAQTDATQGAGNAPTDVRDATADVITGEQAQQRIS